MNAEQQQFGTRGYAMARTRAAEAGAAAYARTGSLAERDSAERERERARLAWEAWLDRAAQSTCAGTRSEPPPADAIESARVRGTDPLIEYQPWP